jgi:hypothetical protein
MNKRVSALFVGVVFLLLVSCLVFMIKNLNALMLPQVAPQVADQLAESTATMLEQLRAAPWQGLRYLEKERTWRFYGVAGESRQIDLIYPITLIKVFYLGRHEDIGFTWVASTVEFPNQKKVSLAHGSLVEGQLVAVQVRGAYVGPDGVDWQACDSDYCRLAEQIDTLLVLDDQGTGISNGFIRYGWAPPTYPSYGFLCWQMMPLASDLDSLLLAPGIEL